MTYRSPDGLRPYQTEGIIKWLGRRSLLCTWEVGTGKSHLAMGAASALHEEGLVGLVVIVCEQSKVKEWVEDFAAFTDLRVAKYTGTPSHRETIRESLDSLDVIVTTYETSRIDTGRMVKIEGKRGKSFEPGPLLDPLCIIAKERGIGIIYDESNKIGNRKRPATYRNGKYRAGSGSAIHQAHEFLCNHLRSLSGNVWVAGLTGTPVETSPENIFNQLRVVAPDVAGPISHFEKDHIRYRDNYGRAKFKNLTDDDSQREPWVTPFKDKIAEVIDFKSKADPDVACYFPEPHEEIAFVSLPGRQATLYHTLDDLLWEAYEPDEPPPEAAQTMLGVKRLVAAYPEALVDSQAAQRDGSWAHTVVTTVGEKALREMGSAKAHHLIKVLGDLTPRHQVLVFSFFANTVVPLLHRDIDKAGFSVVSYTGAMTKVQREKSLDAFKSGEASVLLMSDAGARGLNLSQASYVVNFELCLTHAKTMQRIGRASRMGQGGPSVTGISLVALDTVEEAVVRANLRRQEWSEMMTVAEELPASQMTAEDRRVLFARERRKAS